MKIKMKMIMRHSHLQWTSYLWAQNARIHSLSAVCCVSCRVPFSMTKSNNKLYTFAGIDGKFPLQSFNALISMGIIVQQLDKPTANIEHSLGESSNRLLRPHCDDNNNTYAIRTARMVHGLGQGPSSSYCNSPVVCQLACVWRTYAAVNELSIFSTNWQSTTLDGMLW